MSLNKKYTLARKFFKYIENIWIGSDGKPSLKNLAAIALISDFIVNVHSSVSQFLRLVYMNSEINAEKVSALAGNLAQMAMILGIEAALIAAILGLKTYQNNVFSKQQESKSEEGA